MNALYRADDPNIVKVAHPFDWTFSTNYSGSLKNGLVAQPTDKRIDMAKLMQREQILYYREVTLFEDELHDNGTVLSSIKIVSDSVRNNRGKLKGYWHGFNHT